MGFSQEIESDLKKPPAEETFPELTVRELEMLELIAQGSGNSQIAEELVITDATVRNHIASIFAVILVARRTQTVIKAREAGLH